MERETEWRTPIRHVPSTGNRQISCAATLKRNGAKLAPALAIRRTGSESYLRLLQEAGLSQQAGVSDTRWAPRTSGERLAVWMLSWRWTRCGNPHCRCARDPRRKHGPYLSLRIPSSYGARHQVYIPVEQAAAVAQAVRRAKGVRKRRLHRQYQYAQRVHRDAREGRALLRLLRIAYGRPGK